MKKHFLFLGLLVALPASAEGVYIFGDAGQSTLSFDVGGGDFDKTGTTYSVGLGYDATPTFSFELAYRDLGDVGFNYWESKAQLDGSAIQASVVAKYPISPVVNVFGRIGISRLDYETKFEYFDYPEDNESGSEKKNKAFYGLGAAYSVSGKVILRAEYNRHADWDDVTISTLTVGAAYKF